MSKEDAVIYREAARIVSCAGEESPRAFSCNAIDLAAGFDPWVEPFDRSSQRNKYCRLLAPVSIQAFTGGVFYAKAQHHRIVALCFAAAMAEAGDL